MNSPWPVATNPLDALSQDEVLMKWQELKANIEKAKEAEMEMRKYIVSREFPEKNEGMNTLDLGNGYKLKAGVKLNYNLDGDNAKVEAALDAIAMMGNEGAFLAERLVTWKPSFLLTEYRTLCEPDATDIQKQIKKKIEEVLTISEASPTLAITEPKAKK